MNEELEFKLWDYIKQDYTQSNKTISPLHINFLDPANMLVRLQPRIWIVRGMVAQIIHYGEYDPSTQLYANPVIREQWVWGFDKSTDMVCSRKIVINGYNQQGTILPDTVSSTKYYPTEKAKVNEMVRRRENLIYDIRDRIVHTLNEKLTEGNITEAITITHLFMTTIRLDTDAYILSGDMAIIDDLLSPTPGSVRNRFCWLNKDMRMYGYSKRPIWQLLVTVLKDTTSRLFTNFDYTELK